MLGNRTTQGAQLVVGPAGTGKTTLLRERYVELVRAGETGILFLVHSRRAARSLGDEVLREAGASSEQVRVATWHSFGLSLLRAHHRLLGYLREPALLTGPEQFTLVREMLSEPAEMQHWNSFRKHLRLVGFVQELREFVLRAQDALRLPEDLVEVARAAGRTDLEEAARFFRRYLDRMDSRSDAVVDHANVIARAWQLMCLHPEVATQVKEGTRHILVDDYQDVTTAQHALLRELFVVGGSVTVAADPAARIFGFRGGAGDAIERFARDFGPVTRLDLDTVHRGNPVKEAWLFDHRTDEADAIARECRRLHVREATPYGEIAVLVRRFGSNVRALGRAFERAQVPYIVVGENRPLVNEPSLIPMLELARAALRAPDRDELLPTILSSPVVGLDPYEVRTLHREARVAGTTLAGLLAAPAGLSERLERALSTLRGLLDEIARLDATGRPDEVFWFMWERLDYFRALVASGDEVALDAVTAFGRAIQLFSDRRPGKRFGDYLDVLEGVDFGPEPWHMPESRRPDAVRIMTAHSAAGTEFDAVIVAGCIEGEFPDLRARRPLFDLRDLIRPADPAERAKARLEGERRLFGVATSRARRRLLLTAAAESKQGVALVASPLVALIDLQWAKPPVAWDALTRDEAEARARMALGDTTATDAERAQALDLLARLPGVDPDAWWFERDWTDPGIPIAPDDLRTSYSRLSNYDNCPLQYLYQTELGLDPSQSHQMLVGTWVHDIIDRASRKEIEDSEDALFAALDALWDPTIFGSIAIEHQRKIDCREMLRRWLKIDGPLDTLASETPFEFPIEKATMRGRIDRVVRLGGSKVRLIDYKTGRNAKTNDEAKEDLQLATYYLALTRVDELKQLGEPKVLELVYLGAMTKPGGYMRASANPGTIPGYGEKALERLEGLVAGIRSEEFAPSPSADCQWCSFKTLCPVWQEGDEVKL